MGRIRSSLGGNVRGAAAAHRLLNGSDEKNGVVSENCRRDALRGPARPRLCTGAIASVLFALLLLCSGSPSAAFVVPVAKGFGGAPSLAMIEKQSIKGLLKRGDRIQMAMAARSRKAFPQRWRSLGRDAFSLAFQVPRTSLSMSDKGGNDYDEESIALEDEDDGEGAGDIDGPDEVGDEEVGDIMDEEEEEFIAEEIEEEEDLEAEYAEEAYHDEEDEEYFEEDVNDEYFEQEEDTIIYDLQDDPNDPNYQLQKTLVDVSASAREKIQESSNFEPLQYVLGMTNKEEKEWNDNPIIKQVEELTDGMLLTEEDLEGIDAKKEAKKVKSILDTSYPPMQEGDTDVLEPMGINESEVIEMQEQYELMKKAQSLKSPFHKFMSEDVEELTSGLSNETKSEIVDCLRIMGYGPNDDVVKWLLYDLNFNVTNLMLAAIKHNPDAPLLLRQWVSQLSAYPRYKDAADRGFDFTSADAEAADVAELKKYYKGFGYDDIPTRLSGETGIIKLDDWDEDDIEMSAMQNWISEVYDEEEDEYFFDDKDFDLQLNAFDPDYERNQPPDPNEAHFEKELDDWNKENHDDDEYKEFVARKVEYKWQHDAERAKSFRGHLVVACSSSDDDLEIAETITSRMSSKFGKQVFVETRVFNHARQEDHLFEVWLESYEIDLIHSRRRAVFSAANWDGPKECDAKQVDYLVERVGFLISDEHRYSYRIDDYAGV